MSGLDKNTVALLHFNDSVTKDECGNTWTAVGSPVISSEQSKFGGKSYTNSKSGSYINTGDSKFNIGTQDYTIDCWVYPLSISANQGIVTINNIAGGLTTDWTTNAILLNENGGWKSGSYFSVPSTNKVANSWNHYAMVRSGTNFYYFINGILSYSSTDTYNYTTKYVAVGNYYNGNYDFTGYIDEVRISIGVARWTDNFTPPVTEYNSISYFLYIDENNKVYGIV